MPCWSLRCDERLLGHHSKSTTNIPRNIQDLRTVSPIIFTRWKLMLPSCNITPFGNETISVRMRNALIVDVNLSFLSDKSCNNNSMKYLISLPPRILVKLILCFNFLFLFFFFYLMRKVSKVSFGKKSKFVKKAFNFYLSLKFYGETVAFN